jgi:hypothetical protein
MICQMVWTELKLGKVVDWRTLKAALNIHIPTKRDIPQGVLKFLGGGLSIRRTQVEKPDPYEMRDSSPDNDSDGSQPLKLSNNLAPVASRRLWMRKRGRDDEQLPPLHPPDLHMVPHMPGASNTTGTSNTAGMSNTLGASIIAGAGNIAGTNDTAGASDNVGVGGMLLSLALQGANNIAGAHASAGADNNMGAYGSAGAN